MAAGATRHSRPRDRMEYLFLEILVRTKITREYPSSIDTEADLCFCGCVAFSATPANAEEGVKARVDYVSPYVYGRGLLDIIEHILAEPCPPHQSVHAFDGQWIGPPLPAGLKHRQHVFHRRVCLHVVRRRRHVSAALP